MSKERTALSDLSIKDKIFTIRGMQVMLDSNLAILYGVELRRLNEQVKRNIERFPKEFMFQLTKDEYEVLRLQIVTLNKTDNLRKQTVTSSENSLKSQNATLKTQRGKHRKYLPYVFTEQGVSMLSAVLRSKTAIEVSIKIINTFVEMRRFLHDNAQLFSRLESVERRQIAFESETGTNFEKIFKAIESKDVKAKQGIFFNGQIFDAYVFVSDLIKSADNSIVLIDNYVDETVLTLLAKRKKKCSAVIYTKNISKKLELDLKKYNDQYPPVEIHTFSNAHDRFLILDKKEIYHIGASLKDMGKKWFAFSKFEKGALQMLDELESAKKKK